MDVVLFNMQMAQNSSEIGSKALDMVKEPYTFHLADIGRAIGLMIIFKDQYGPRVLKARKWMAIIIMVNLC